jgi:hypothetical protein
MKKIFAAVIALGLLAAAPSMAAQCKDPKTHKFIKCPPPAATAAVSSASPAAATAAATKCRDAKGKFTKCPTTGAAPKKQCRDAKGKFTKCPV